VSMRTFSQLTTLIFLNVDAASSEQIPLVLRHSADLEVLEVYGELDETFYTALGEDLPLPHLRRLRIILDHTFLQTSPSSFLALNLFLCARQSSLKFLDIELNPASWTDFSIILTSLSQIEVLGIGPNTTLSTHDQMDTLINHLPRSMRSLRLSISDPHSDPRILHQLVCICAHYIFALEELLFTDTIQLAYIDVCPNLEFIQICTPRTQACTIEDLLHLDQLGMAILNNHVWELRRLSDGTISPYLWPSWKFQFRSTLDFPSEAAAWLTTSSEWLNFEFSKLFCTLMFSLPLIKRNRQPG
jgi:hypothetical protein